MSDARTISLTVNGVGHTAAVEPRVHLGDFLRQTLGLTGTHLGCEHGVCGACTVVVDGRPVRACLMLAVQAAGADVRTVEGLADGDTPSRLQQAFSTCHALQCGFCTAGMLMTLDVFLRAHPAPTESEVRVAISGNICRCTGYQGIVEAALQVARAGGRPT